MRSDLLDMRLFSSMYKKHIEPDLVNHEHMRYLHGYHCYNLNSRSKSTINTERTPAFLSHSRSL